MLEHLSQEQIERYGRRTMPPAELLAVDDHLAACAACRQRLGDGEREQLGQAFASLQTDLRSAARVRPDHPGYEQLAAYLDNTLDTVDREIVESHLDLCAQCATEASDLRAFANQLKTDPVKSYAPPSLRDKFLAVWHWPARWTPLPLAGVAALLVTVGIAGLRWAL